MSAADLAAAFTATQQPIRYAADPAKQGAFHREMAKNVDDHLPPLVYADYLDEEGHPLADLIRHSVARKQAGGEMADDNNYAYPRHRDGFGSTARLHTEPEVSYDVHSLTTPQYDPETFATHVEPDGARWHTRDPIPHHYTGERVVSAWIKDPQYIGKYENPGAFESYFKRMSDDEVLDFFERLGGDEGRKKAEAYLGRHPKGETPKREPRPQQLQRRSQPIRYAKSKRNRVHPLLRGTRLAVVLKEIAKDKQRPDTAEFARGILYTEHGPTRFGPFSDHLQDTDHPLFGHYNWPAISDKLLHDAAALGELKRHVREDRRRDVARGEESRPSLNRAVGIIGVALNPALAVHGHLPRYAAAIRAVDPHASDAQVQESLRRVHDRVVATRIRQSDDTRDFAAAHSELRKRKALQPKEEAKATIAKAGGNEEAVATEEALRYERPVVGGVKNALRLMQSRNQQQYRSVAADVLKRLGLSPSKVRDGVTLSGAPVASVVAAIYHGGDSGRAEAAAAYFGHLMQLPSVTTFHADDSGSDSLYKLSLAMAPAAAAQHLQRHGVTRCVLVPNRTGTDVLIHDPGRRQADKVASAAQGGEVQETVGRSVRLGHADGHRADANSRRSYRQVISQFEEAANGSRQQPAADGNSPSPRAAADAAATAAARD